MVQEQAQAPSPMFEGVLTSTKTTVANMTETFLFRIQSCKPALRRVSMPFAHSEFTTQILEMGTLSLKSSARVCHEPSMSGLQDCEAPETLHSASRPHRHETWKYL